jgi:hypothetical protein
MADWRQIQARIRKAKTSSNPSAKLSELYQRTRDAMVAWELGSFEEKNGRADEAAKWYAAAAQRFRRAEWKKKAEEALTRLGVEVPATVIEPGAKSADEVTSEPPVEPQREVHYEPQMPLAVGEIAETSPALGEILEASTSESTDRPQTPTPASGPVEGQRKRRRGRRGGRGRRRKTTGSPSLPAQTFASAAPTSRGSAPTAEASETMAYPVSGDIQEEPKPERHEERKGDRADASGSTPGPSKIQAVDQAEPRLPSERTTRGRAGDPALASRMAHLESMLRRLLSSPLHRLDELDDAPAGPGVFLLSDSDQVTSYYVESCQTLRIGLGNLARGGRGGRGHRSGSRAFAEVDLKEKLADHLGINQSKVSQYMKDHCVVRWIQLDDDAPHLAHFAVGVLRTPLNLD